MARNEEKAQSMLYRFRQAKAMEMGLISQSDKRPRMASACKDLRQAEKWRGEIMREISRKVTKIQDYNLSDYEVRDLNDEINKLMREKSHWENQIIALGGANYKRAAPSIKGADGREVPGMRGYKYFGRARELPGVKELFETAQKNEDELTSFKRQRYAIYENVGPEYYGDVGEDVEDMLSKAEQEAEDEEWQDAVADVADTIGAEPDELPLPPRPKPDYISFPAPSTSQVTLDGQEVPPPPPPPPPAPEEQGTEAEAEAPKTRGRGKRKAAQKTDDAPPASKAAKTSTAASTAASSNRILTILREEDFKPAQLPSLEDLERFLVEKQKQELLKEYV